MNWRLLDSTWN